jgi:integrase
MKQETLSILFFILKNKNKLLKNGEAPVLLRVTIERRGSDEVRIQRSTNPNLWDQAKGRSKGKDHASLELNDFVKSLGVKLSIIHKEMLLEQAFITPSLLLRKLFSTKERRTILSTFRDHNEECRKLIGIDYEKVTINRYDNCMRSLATAIQREYGKEDITFYELTGEFIRKYEVYLKTEKKLCQNTVVRYMKCFKKITNMALANNWLKCDPFVGRKYRQEETNPTFLTMEELETMMKKKFAIERLEIVRNIFVFCAFTGLAFIDAHELKPEHIFKDNNGCLWIRKGREKMKHRQEACVSNIPLLGVAQQILEKYKDHPICREKDVCLPVYSNQKMNSYLKEIADFCGINKNITTDRLKKEGSSLSSFPLLLYFCCANK